MPPKMHRPLAFFLSVLLHPVFMPLVLYGLIFFYCHTAVLVGPTQKWLLLGYIGVFTTLLPVISLLLMKKSKVISSYHLADRGERMLPYMVSTVYYTLLAYGLVERNFVGSLIGGVAVGMALLMLFLTLATNFSKVSAHTTAVSGILGFLLGIQLIYPAFELLLPIVITTAATGWVMSARLALNAHTPFQVTSGLFLGFTVCFLSVVGILKGMA